MKYSMKLIFAISAVALIVISSYQTYWLVDIYHSLHTRLVSDVKESVRAADFQEIIHRVNAMRNDSSVGGKMDISVGMNGNDGSTSLTNETSDLDGNNSKNNLNAELPSGDFTQALAHSDDVMNVGLSMQRGIHSGLDRMRPIDTKLYNSLLRTALDSLGVDAPHCLLHLRRESKSSVDTLARIGLLPTSECDTFSLRLDVASGTEYMVLVPITTSMVLKQMRSPLLFSAAAMLMLVLAFGYIISMLRSLHALDEMKSDFTNNITHELKTPIAVAYAANDALLNFSHVGKDPKAHKYLSICQEQLRLLTRLVEQILSLSMERRNSMVLTLEPIQLEEELNRLADNIRLKASKPLTRTVEVPHELTLTTDRLHFTNIVSNLLDNALKYSGDEVTIDLRASAFASGVEISVADNGIGIPMSKQPYIFDKFYRVPHGNLHSVKGYGLGLFYVRSIMQKLGGTVSVTSEPGCGTTFRLRFNE